MWKRIKGRLGWFLASLASTHQMLVATPGCDNWRCLRALPHVPRGAGRGVGGAQSFLDEDHCPQALWALSPLTLLPNLPHPHLHSVGRNAKCLGNPTRAALPQPQPGKNVCPVQFTVEGCITVPAPLPDYATLYRFPNRSESHTSHLQNKNNPSYLVGRMITV